MLTRSFTALDPEQTKLVAHSLTKTERISTVRLRVGPTCTAPLWDWRGELPAAVAITSGVS
jgi:hypothetical protein